jgi:hypothetical protein
MAIGLNSDNSLTLCWKKIIQFVDNRRELSEASDSPLSGIGNWTGRLDHPNWKEINPLVTQESDAAT